MADWSKIYEIDRARNSEHPWVTIAASAALVVIGVVCLFWGWHLLRATLAAASEADRFGMGDDVESDAVGLLGLITTGVGGFGFLALGGGVTWMTKGIIALVRGERVETCGVD